jgi:hypothetical protein
MLTVPLFPLVGSLRLATPPFFSAFRRSIGESNGIGVKRVTDEVSEDLWGSSESGRRVRRGHGGTAIGRSCRTGIETRSTLIETWFFPGVHLESWMLKSQCSS